MPLVAVYGTLKVGEYNYERWLAGHEPLFRGVVEIPYRMFACDEYPMLVPNGERHSIVLDVFDVNEETLAGLDALEGPYGYHRESLFLPALAREVEIYVHPRPAPAGFRPVASGNWPETPPG